MTVVLVFYLYHLWWSRQSAFSTPEPATQDEKKGIVLPKKSTAIVKFPEVDEQHKNRIMLSESALSLVKQYLQRTAIQSDEIFESVYYGKWMLLELSVFEIEEYEVVKKRKHLAVSCWEYRGEEREFVMAHFDDQWRDHLSHLPKESQVKICGQLKKVDTLGVVLEKCELV